METLKEHTLRETEREHGNVRTLFPILKVEKQTEFSTSCLQDTESIQHYDSVYLDINLWSLSYLILISFVRYKLRKTSARGDLALCSSLKETEHGDRQQALFVQRQSYLASTQYNSSLTGNF